MKVILTDLEAVSHLYEAWRLVGGLGGNVVPTFAAIGVAESGLNILAMNPIWAPGEDKHLSNDVGWLQFNTWYNGVVSIDDMQEFYDPLYSAVRSLRLFKSVKPYGAGYMRWNTYKNGLHIPHMPRMTMFARSIGVPGV